MANKLSGCPMVRCTHIGLVLSMPGQQEAWIEAMELLNEYGVGWPKEMERRVWQLRGAGEHAEKMAHIKRIIECLVQFHFPGGSH